ncbi:MAG TPA: adenylyltransferase/cytidyltransferase family protein [Candidatus Limnocylindrales bacterium]|nr:adenylyltransferase/cytidyltransferase family protein [Candidatus Limnocylindrales bacterium]
MSKRIGIFAGTFDPVHEGHLAFARTALKQGMDRVMFLVEPRPRRKQGVRALEHRVAMVQLAIKDEPDMGTIILEQARFTPHETLPALQARFKGYRLVLLFGDDVITHIAHWPHIDSLVQAAELLIASRHKNPEELHSTMRTLEQTRNLKFRYKTMHLDYKNVASSLIRLKLKRREPAPGVPLPVQDYIRRHRLYVSSGGNK